MILFNEIASTLTSLLETFPNLSQCIEGLEDDKKLGWLDSVRWLSKADELTGYWQKREKDKTSLTLMISILTKFVIFFNSSFDLSSRISLIHSSSESVQAAEIAVAELRIVVVESHQHMSEKMARKEIMLAQSSNFRADNDSPSILSRETTRDAMFIASTYPQIFAILGHTFDEDLQTSWVYRRTKSYATRPYSLAFSTQGTQS
ncbi:hypothetical protein VTL71DRAFT_13874 [Oculimacula yallundae]|uniref:Uncharacterized protein n=1 Tax=Oculimacula yallundae TaxID=86028 RepID=A0ABR4CLK5_9HELO